MSNEIYYPNILSFYKEKKVSLNRYQIIGDPESKSLFLDRYNQVNLAILKH